MTLVETLIALAVFAVVIVAVGAFQAGIFQSQRTVGSSLQTAQDAQVILRTMLTELRSAAPGANGIYTIAQTGTSTLSFFTDFDNDAVTEKVTYSLVGNTLYRAVIQPAGSPLSYNIVAQATSSLLTDVRNTPATPVFLYFDQYYTGTSSPMTQPVNPSAVRLIQVSLMLDTDPSKSPLPRTYSTQVSLRNLKTNL